MRTLPEAWDYLIVTASHAGQARAYEAQLGLRRRMGQLTRAREVLVVADPDGQRIGSGGSTLHSLRAVVKGADAAEALRGRRILIVHAGGDSRRLPAYSPCGKIFVPVPGQSQSALGMTLFDRLAPLFLDLPGGAPGAGQVVVTSGDALTRFDPRPIQLAGSGMIALASYAAPEEAARHGVFAIGEDGAVRLYLQKPGPAEQAAAGAINRFGQTALDIGVMSFDASTAAALLRTFENVPQERVMSLGLDLYREICCAMGTEASFAHYLQTARAAGSRWEEGELAQFYASLRAIPLRVEVLPRCDFLHFGSTRQLIASGYALTVHDLGMAPPCLALNNELGARGSIAGHEAWVEGCRVNAPLTLAGRNVVAGVDVDVPLGLPPGACLDVLPIRNRAGGSAWAIRCYDVGDSFKDAQYGGRPLADWLAKAGLKPEDVWPDGAERTLWNARMFPAEESPGAYRHWLWMFDVNQAKPSQKEAFLAADRYSAAELALAADQDAFHQRRARIRASEISRSLEQLFGRESRFSAEDLAFALEHAANPAEFAAGVLKLAQSYWPDPAHAVGMESFVFCRVLHSLASAVERREERPRFEDLLDQSTREWMTSLCLAPQGDTRAADWANRAQAAAFRQLNRTILSSSMSARERPRNALRADETIWGRGPARIELGGGWTDTPPYTLEYGGDVINAAVNLNGQPPIHCYCRVVEEPVIRLSSIDGGRHIEITQIEELLDFGRPEDRFALAKAALAMSGFSPEIGGWTKGETLRRMLAEFGGGIELTTLVGIPQGSGLGTSSILGAVILAVIRRMMGRPQSQRELFHEVLRLEQALTTGGGWQDQIGGGVGGTKITSTRPGLFPDPSIHYVPSDVIDPKLNGGATLLYYTGLTRLAKNILRQIVGGYLNRDRAILQALEEEHQVAHAIADAMARKDAAACGHYVNAAWELQKRLCGTVTNETIETLLARVRPHVHGMRISGAGSGGFLLMISKSPQDAARVREMLEREPLNESARFFDFEINQPGLQVTTC